MIVFGFTLALLSACGGGGGSSGKKPDSQQASTGGGESSVQPPPSDNPVDGTSPPATPDASDRGAGIGDAGISAPVVSGVATDQGLIGPGRIIDSTIAFMGTGHRGNVVELYLNGQLAGSSVAREDGSWMLDYSFVALVPGVYSCTLISVSTAGVETPSAAPFVFQYDPSAPLAPIISGITHDSANIPDGITNDNTLVISGTAEANSVLELFLNNVLVATTQVDGNGNWVVDYSAVTLADGNYTLAAESNYLTLRSATSALFPVVVDTQAPVAPVINGISPDTGVSSVDGITNHQYLVISGTAEPDVTVRVQLGGTTVGSVRSAMDGSWTLNYSVVMLAEGNYLWRALQVDKAGNTSVLSVPLPLVIDVTPPAGVTGFTFSPDTGVLGDNVTNSGGLLLSGNAPANEWVTVLIDSVAIGTVQADALGAWQLDYSATLLPDATYRIATRVSDAAGNMSSVSAGINITIDSVLPAAPVITDFVADTGTIGDFLTADSTLMLNGTADADGTIELFVNGITAGTATVNGAGDWQFDYSGVALGSGVYIFTATVTDLSDNLSPVSSNFVITIDGIAPLMPVISSISTDTGIAGDGVTNDNTLIISGLAEAGAQVTVFIDGVAAGAVAANGAGAWSLDYSAVSLADGAYVLQALAMDAAGNTSVLSLPFSIVIDSGVPAAPVVQAISTDTAIVGDGVTSDNTLVFSGIAEVNSTVQIYVDGSLVGSAGVNGAGVWNFDYSATSLADGAYAITAIATDASGNASAFSSVFNLMVDAVAPSAPAGLAIDTDTGVVGDGITSDNTLTLSGTGEADASVNVLLDGVSIGTVIADGAGSWTLDYSTIALAEGSYTFTVTATDSAGNVSSASTFVITTDFTLPVAGTITAISADSGVVGDGITNDANLVFGGSAEVDATVALIVDGVSVGSTVVDGSGNWIFDYSAVTLAEGSHVAWIVVTDAAANSSVASATLIVLIDTDAPSVPVIAGISDDTGVVGDGITSDNRITISGTGETGSVVSLYLDGGLAGSVIADGAGNWTFDYSATVLAGGAYAITAAATDVAANVSATSTAFNVVIDSGVPAAPLIAGITDDAGAAGDGITNDNQIVITGSAEANAVVTVLLDAVAIGTVAVSGGGDWSFDYTATTLADGSYVLTATARDAAGNNSAASVAFNVVIDNLAPNAPVVNAVSDDTGVDGDGITSDATVIIGGTAEAGATISVLIDAVAQGIAIADGAGDWRYDNTSTVIADGIHFITAVATDVAGNASLASPAFAFTVDTAAPSVPVLTGISNDSGVVGDNITSDTTLIISGTSDPDVEVMVYRDGVVIGTQMADGSGNWSFDYSAVTLADGDYAFYATAGDVTGNVSSASAATTVSIDATIPAAPLVTGITLDSGVAGDGITNDAALVISGTGEANAVITVLVDASSVGTAVANGMGVWSFDYSGNSFLEGSYTITATATDGAANTSLVSGIFNLIVDASAPAAPVIIAINTDTGAGSDGVTSDNTLTIAGTAEANASINVYRDAVLIGAVNADGVGSWSFDYTGTALVDAAYIFTATATDNAANVSAASSDFAVTIDTAAPAAPVISAISNDTGVVGDGITSDNTLTVSGTAENNATIAVLLDAGIIGTVLADGSGNWSFSYGSAIADGAYTVTATATDSAANVSAASSTLNIVIDTAAPVAPVISTIADDTGTAADGITSDTSLIIGGSAEANAVIAVLVNAVSVGTTATDGSGNWNFDYSGMALAEGAYAITATATDAAANVSAISTAFNLVIDSGVPSTPVITGITDDSGTAGDGITNDNQIVITGSAEANAVVTVLLDTVAIGTAAASGGGGWSFDYTATTLADGLYVLAATASDVAGNVSAVSAAYNLTVDTSAPVAPVVSAISTDTGTGGDGITSDTTLVIAGAAEAGASVVISLDASVIATVVADGSGSWSYDYGASVSLADGSHSITATATDSAANVSTVSAAFTVLIDTAAPAAPVISAITMDAATVGDGITNDNALVINGTAQINGTVTVYLDASSIGTVASDGGGNWSFDHTGAALADGTYTLTATTTDAAANVSALSAGFVVTVDTVAPAVATLMPADSATGVALTDNVVITFDAAVYAGSGNIIIRHFIDNSIFESVPVSDARVTGSGTNTLTINPAADFVGGTQYYVETDMIVSDLAGNVFAGVSGNTAWNFSTVPISLLSSTPADEATGVALDTSLLFTFSESVSAGTGSVLVRKISDNSIADTIDLANAIMGGDGTDTITLSLNTVLDTNTAYYIEIEAGGFVNANNVAFAGVSGNSILNFTTANVSVPSVFDVTASVANGTYRGNDTIPIQIQFDEIVVVTGVPQIFINLDGADKNINYTSGSGTDTLQFDFLVFTGDSTSDLEYVSAASLILNGGTIRSVNSANANVVLPAPGEVGSLGVNKDIVITAAALDMSSFSSGDGFIVEGDETGNYFGRGVGAGGDVNGDGFEDFVVGVSLSDVDGVDSGAVYVIFGKAGATRADINVGTLAATDGFMIRGASAVDYLGMTVDLSGDINGDGYDDVVVVASHGDIGAVDAGIVYVIWGVAGSTRADIDLSSLSSADGFSILGYESSDSLGNTTLIDPQNAQFLDADGDFNGDGIHDLLIGHHQSDAGGVDSGVAYVIFGQTGATRSNINLSSIAGQGFRIVSGGNANELLGFSVQFVGDYNGDGFNDILIGAAYSDVVAPDAGQAYLIFGHAGPAYNDVDVSALSGTDGFTISTSEISSWLGGSVAATDINGDGLTDLLFGNTASDANGKVDSGSVLVLYGNAAVSHSDVAFGSVAIGNGFTIYGEDISDFMAHAVRGAGDVDGDGIGDLLVSTWVDDEGGVDAGAAWIIYGKVGAARADIDLSVLDSSDGFKIIGDAAVDYFGRVNAAGDINGDGYQDFLIASPLGDNAGADMGEVNVIWGKDFRSRVYAGLTGNASANNLVGTSDANTIVGGGGADRISAGSGNDTIQVASLNFAHIDGGRGNDTLELTGMAQVLDLRTLNYEVINGIEIINLGNRGNALTLDKSSLLALSDEVRTLYVRGGNTDWIVTDNAESWTANGSTVVNSITYNRYDLNEVSLFVQTAMSQPATPAAPVITAYATDTGTIGDFITSDTGLVFSGATGAYFGIEIFIDAVSVGSTSANAAGAWTFDYSSTTLSQGTYAITAQATNPGAYVSAVSAALTVTVDTTAPSVPVVTGITTDTNVAGDGVTSDASLVISGTADALTNITVRLNGSVIGTVQANGAGNWSYDHTGTVLSAGSYAATAIASDAAANASAASSAFNITVDNSAPAAPVITGISTDTGVADGITSDTTLLVSGTAEAGAMVVVLVGGTPVGSIIATGGVWTFDYTGTTLAPGNFAFNATAMDLAGNISSASTTFNVTVDTSAPGVPVIVSITADTGAADGVTSDTTLFVSGTSDAGVAVRVFRDGISVGTTSADGSGNWIFDYSATTLAQGSYVLTATAADVAANTSAASSAFNITIDTTAPAKPSVTAISTDTGTPGDGITSDNQIVISGTAEANSTVTVRRNGVALGSVVVNGVGAWSYDYTATTLSDGSYTLTAFATDLAGNVSAVSANFVITIDTSTPVAPAVTAITTDSASTDGITNDNTLIISGTGESGLTLTVLLGGSSIGTTAVSGGGTWSFNYTGTTLSDASYTFAATQQDSAGNASVASGNFAVTIDTVNPFVSTLTPVDDVTNAGFTSNLVMVFDGAVTAQSGNIVIRNASDNSAFETIPVGDARVTGSGTNTITINPSGTFVGGSNYYVQIDATAFDDVAGNSYAGIANTTSWNFTTAPTAIISSTPADNTTGVALNASITLNFNENVTTNTGSIVIRKMSDNSAWDTIAVGSGQVSGSGTSTITIAQTDVLEPNTAYYIEIAAGAFRNSRSVNFAGISGNSTLNFTSANVAIPTIINVTSSTANGTYVVGSAINISVVFSEIVNVTLASPRITLDMVGVDRTVSYVSGSGTTTLSFNYTVVLGDSAADLDYLNVSAFDRNGSRIRSVNFANANVALFNPGTAGSLGANKNIAINAGSLDLSSMTSADGFQVQGSTAGEHLGWAVAALGDVNGDGYEDFVTGAPDNNGSAGVTYVVYGQPGVARSNVNTSAITNGTNGFKIVGQSAVDKLGGSVGGAGDINDDGYADIFVVAPLDDDYGSDAGIVYVIYGKASNTDINISSFSSSNGFRITTSEVSARIADSFTGFNGNGQGIDAGGDFNGDGVDDLIIGLRFADKNTADSGKAYVIFGKKATTRSDVNLDLINDTGPDGMLIYGASAGWQLGQSVRFVGDYDADGFDDVLTGAIFSNAVASNAGQAYLIFGAPGPVFYPINVSTLNGGSGFKIYSSDVWGIIGHSAGGGDFNGDGISDFVVSSNGKNINGKSGNGAAFVIYGNNSGSYSNIDIDTMLTSTGYAIYGEAASDNMGHSLESAGDFNADGVDDVLLGTYLNNSGGSSAGAAWMVMGLDGNTRSDVDLENLTNANGVKVIGDAADDRFAQATGYGDINGDGYSDLILGAPLGDNASADGGETVVIWGREFSQSITVGLVGDGNANNIVGTSGNDTIVSGGGADAISAGSGNDTIQLYDTDFYNIEGGRGTDTLQFVTTLNTLNLSTLGLEVIKGIEIIDLGSSNSLQVSKEGVQALSRESRILYVKGDSSDVVTSTTGDAWCYTGTKLVGGITYNVYLDNGAVLYVQSSINTTGITSFNSTQTYTFNTTSGGANVSGNVTGFPVLIRISNTIRNTLQSDRDDIRFTDKDQVSWLPYELETGASGELYAWVLVPQIDGNSSSDYIVMHYNDKEDGAVPNRQNPSNVWADYSGVWHFAEASGGILDSTAYLNNGTQSGTVSRENSFIGRGVRFDTSSERFTVPYDASFNVSNKNFTVELWLDGTNNCTTSFVALDHMTGVSRGEGTSRFWRVITGGSFPPYWGGFVASPGVEIGDTSGSELFRSTGWVSTNCSSHMVLDHNRSYGTRVYMDGSLAFSDSTVRNIENLQSLIIGNSGGSSDMRIDEVRIISQSLSADRAKLSYQNQKSSNSLVSP